MHLTPETEIFPQKSLTPGTNPCQGTGAYRCPLGQTIILTKKRRNLSTSITGQDPNTQTPKITKILKTATRTPTSSHVAIPSKKSGLGLGSLLASVAEGRGLSIGRAGLAMAGPTALKRAQKDAGAILADYSWTAPIITPVDSPQV
jgi:hypothetical protein